MNTIMKVATVILNRRKEILAEQVSGTITLTLHSGGKTQKKEFAFTFRASGNSSKNVEHHICVMAGTTPVLNDTGSSAPHRVNALPPHVQLRIDFFLAQIMNCIERIGDDSRGEISSEYPLNALPSRLQHFIKELCT